MCLDPFEGDRGRLLHHVAQIAREAQAALAGREHRLDVEDVAAHFRPGKAVDHAGLLPVRVEGRGIGLTIQQLGQLIFCNGNPLYIS